MITQTMLEQSVGRQLYERADTVITIFRPKNKNMQTIVKDSRPENKEVRGKEIKNLSQGTIVKMLRNEATLCYDKPGTILMVTSKDKNPLVQLTDNVGQLWGNDLDNYVFEILPVKTLSIEI